MISIFVNDHSPSEGQHRRGQYHGERRLRVLFLMLHADIKVIVALNCVVAGEHELHALRVPLLYNRLILAHAFEPLFDLPFAHHDVESGHEARLWWIERNLTLELGLTEIEPSFRRFVRLD